MTPTPAAPADALPVSNRTFDRAAIAIFGTMVSLIVLLTAILLSVSTPPTVPPVPTAQTASPPHRA